MGGRRAHETVSYPERTPERCLVIPFDGHWALRVARAHPRLLCEAAHGFLASHGWQGPALMQLVQHEAAERSGTANPECLEGRNGGCRMQGWLRTHIAAPLIEV